jgi:hypothetical protein
MNLRKINFETEKIFTCDGKEFEVTETLSFTRYRELQKIMLEFGFSATFEDIFNNLGKAVESYNKHDYFNMSIILYKMQEGIKNLETKDDPSFRLCALFINEKDEDPTKYSEALMKSKIESWGKELEVTGFFYLAASLVPSWMPAYSIVSQGGSEEEKKEESQK